MLVNKNSTKNWNAISAVNVVNGSGTPVMFMSANYGGTDVSFSKSIKDRGLYEENKQEVDADYESFEEEVLAEIGE